MEESVFIVSDSTIEENLSSNDCGEFLSKPNADFVLVCMEFNRSLAICIGFEAISMDFHGNRLEFNTNSNRSTEFRTS